METPKQKKAREEMLTTTVSLTQDVHRRLKHLAVDQGVSVRDLMREAIEEYLNRKEKEKSFIGHLHHAEKLRTSPSF
jgi:predicted transcriptional regulator